MEARNCPRCGRLFTQIRSPVCSACEKADEDTFQLLKTYIEDHPTCTMSELTTETKVPVRRITQYIRDGRLEISKGMAGDITCDQCGKPIARGRYCETCALAIDRSVKTMFNKINSDTKDVSKGMHSTLGRKKNL